MTGFDSKRRIALDRLDDDDIQIYAQPSIKRPIEADYASQVAYTRALELFCDTLAQPVQEPVGYEHHEYRPFGAPGEIRIHAVLKSQFLHPDGSIGGDFQWLIDSYKADKNTIKLVPLYTTPQKRPWVGLTEEDMPSGEDPMFDHEYFFAGMVYASTLLKEKNT